MHRNQNIQNTSLFLLLILVSLGLLTSFKTPGLIVLQDEKVNFKPTGFYIAGIEDDRVNKNAIAQLQVKVQAGKTTAQSADLQGGPAPAIGKFINRNLPKDETQRPVIINIKELNITETPLDASRVSGNVKLSLAFGLQKDYGTETLVNYQGGFTYTRLTDNIADAETHLRKTVVNSLAFFNNWMKANIPANVKLARNVKISFSNYQDKQEGDTIYYAANRPLTWADFQSKYISRSPSYAAGIMPGFGYDEQANTNEGTIYVNITMKTFLPKSTCWYKYGYKDDVTLNHEQRHFDVVKIITEQYKQKVLAQHLKPDTYEAFINMQYLDSYRDMDEMQKAYDKETSHGRDPYAQAQWNDRIDKQLRMGTRL